MDRMFVVSLIINFMFTSPEHSRFMVFLCLLLITPGLHSQQLSAWLCLQPSGSSPCDSSVIIMLDERLN